MWKRTLIFLCASVLLSACQAKEPNAESDHNETLYQPLEYRGDDKPEKKKQIPIGQDSYFKRSAEKEFNHAQYGETNKSHNNDFYNEESVAITKAVNTFDEVTMTQAFATDDHVYVAVMLNPRDYRDRKIANKIRRKVEGMTEKPVTVYTNTSNWDQMKDLNARLKASQAPNKLKKQVQDFFKMNKGAK
ncbi:YhcN/YlaJ family sporulation lipoprotein [Halobacillus salinarum]|uniref:YhcN/YlaJ family sporulation lipoprotein n=1 Tax=Halobacillus salinarum TaxID=2932257 RepID=A0ABY4EPY6_9BACI|nr:YhcN/YlaJ family sporulation lipoprotein [Halobacillus salinarum]UOQ46264.1 YhcN/YlaJ family sporulation lipoprotein [Halobacillus salinarum]